MDTEYVFIQTDLTGKLDVCLNSTWIIQNHIEIPANVILVNISHVW